jgi:hypothetical protein
MQFINLLFKAIANGESWAIFIVLIPVLLWIGWVTLRIRDLTPARTEFLAVRENNIHIQNQIDIIRKKLD